MRFPNVLNVRFALQGIWTAIREETQVAWSFICAIILMGVALWQGIIFIEFSILLALFGIVIAAEMFNGAIERMCNKIEPNYNVEIKKIKDMASGAVLILALVTLATWIVLVFL